MATTRRAVAPEGAGLGGEFRLDSRGEPFVPGEADGVVDVLPLAEGHELLAGVGGVGADEDLDAGPAAADERDDAPKPLGDALGGVGVAGARDGGQGVVAAEDVQGQEAVVVVVAVEEAALLAAVDLDVGAVDVEDEA